MSYRLSFIYVIALISAISFGGAPSAVASVSDDRECTIDPRGNSFGGSQGVVIDGHCVPTTSGNQIAELQTKTVSCGTVVAGNAGWNFSECGGNVLQCYQVKPGQGNVQVPAMATGEVRSGKLINPQVWCPGDPQPAVTMADIREQAFRLLPRLSVASAWKRTALVNAQVVLWVPTDANRNLPAVDIVGQQVALRIGLTSVRWDFGDGTSDTTSNPGKAYDEARDPCRTAQCPHYYGHTYRHTGKVTISATTSWHVQYRIGDGDWNDLAGPALAAPTSRHTMQILQARGVLVPNPGQH